MADRRNTAVVIALILSLTVGVRILTWLEPAEVQWGSAPALMAERGARIESITIAFVPTRVEADQLVQQRSGANSLCLVYSDRPPEYWAAGPTWDLIVVGSSAERLPKRQQGWLLAALGGLVRPVGLPQVRVELAPDSDIALDPSLPSQAQDLRKLLERKRIIAG